MSNVYTHTLVLIPTHAISYFLVIVLWHVVHEATDLTKRTFWGKCCHYQFFWCTYNIKLSGKLVRTVCYVADSLVLFGELPYQLLTEFTVAPARPSFGGANLLMFHGGLCRFYLWHLKKNNTPFWQKKHRFHIADCRMSDVYIYTSTHIRVFRHLDIGWDFLVSAVS